MTNTTQSTAIANIKAKLQAEVDYKRKLRKNKQIAAIFTIKVDLPNW